MIWGLRSAREKHTAVTKHQKAMVIWQYEHQQHYQTEQVNLPVEPSSPAIKNTNLFINHRG